jgi:hypothetical protein
MLTYVTIVKCAIANFVRRFDRVVDVVNRTPKFIANTDFSFAFFTLLHQVKNQNRTGVTFKKVGEMKLRRSVRWIHSVKLNGGFR